jgi:glucoamylase
LVTTALGPSRVWAATGYGILNEVYWPMTGLPQVRDFGFIVAGGGSWAEVKRMHRYQLTTPKPYIPLAQAVHTGDGYQLTLEFLPDPLRDVLLIRYSLEGDGLRLYPLLAPHLGTSGWRNTAWVDQGLFAQSEPFTLCVLSREPFLRASAGYVGRSDGWQDFASHGQMTYTFSRAEAGNVALMGELEPGDGVLALAFAPTVEGARTLARSSLQDGYAAARQAFVAAWESWGATLVLSTPEPEIEQAAQLSAAMLKVHMDRTFPGAIVASLSIPWGNRTNDLGGYHLVWTRDAVEAGFGLLAANQIDDSRRILSYLAATQTPGGHWAQNFFPDGVPYWTGVQLDEVGFPVLFAAKLVELGAVDPSSVAVMVRRAAAYLVANGPISPQDRWEENEGLSPFSLAVCVAALVAAADFLDAGDRDYVLAIADDWNERIEEWTYAVDGPLARRFGVSGHYVRLGLPAAAGGLRGRVEIRNRPSVAVRADELVGMEFMYLVRLGLRLPDGQPILDTVTVAEGTLRVDTPCGPVYHRYNEDGYGEHEDGAPFDGTGIGRAWPLLTGERGHLALMQAQDPIDYLRAMTCMAGPGGLFPEQVWDRDPPPGRQFEPGRPTGSAMPLVWAHAEFLKLATARASRQPIELLDVVWRRYRGVKPVGETSYWRSSAPFAALPPGRSILVEDQQPFVLHLGFDGWRDVADRPSAPLGLGMHGVRLTGADCQGRTALNFTRYYPATGSWEGRDHAVALATT